MLSCSSLGSIFFSIFRIIKIINYFIYLILLEIIIIVVIVSAFCFFCLFIFVFVVKSLSCIVTPWIEAHPVSSVPEISQARVLGWVAISFPGSVLCVLCHVWLFASPKTRLHCPWDFPGKNSGMGCISFSRESSQPTDWTYVFCIGKQILYHWVSTCVTNFNSFVVSSHSLSLLPSLLRTL